MIYDTICYILISIYNINYIDINILYNINYIIYKLCLSISIYIYIRLDHCPETS